MNLSLTPTGLERPYLYGQCGGLSGEVLLYYALTDCPLPPLSSPSALYVVDLKKFRKIAAGDRLRGQYQGLSQDPNSLSNLDQVGQGEGS